MPIAGYRLRPFIARVIARFCLPAEYTVVRSDIHYWRSYAREGIDHQADQLRGRSRVDPYRRRHAADRSSSGSRCQAFNFDLLLADFGEVGERALNGLSRPDATRVDRLDEARKMADAAAQRGDARTAAELRKAADTAERAQKEDDAESRE
jgi:hypothetical protein